MHYLRNPLFLTANDWQLFTPGINHRGIDRARATTTLNNHLAWCIKECTSCTDALYVMHVVQQKLRKWGACNAEANELIKTYLNPPSTQSRS